MQDFPALFRDISVAAHPPWIVVAVAAILAAFALAVANRLADILAGRAAELAGRLPGKILSPASRIHRVKSPGREPGLTPAQALAKAIRGELDQERGNLKLEAPRPLPTSWKPASVNSPVLVIAAGDRDIADAYTEIWPVPLVILGDAGSGKSVLAQRLALLLVAAVERGWMGARWCW